MATAQLQQVLETRPDEGVINTSPKQDATSATSPPSAKGQEGEKRRASRSSSQNNTDPQQGASRGGGRRAPGNEDPRTLGQMYDRLIMGIIRPPRMAYEFPRALGPQKVVLPCGVRTERTDFEVVNARGHRLQCSVWKPDGLEATNWPCVVCLHGNSSSRLEAAKTNVIQAVMLANCALVGFDFSGCGNSDGDIISLGHFESQDTGSVLEEVKKMGAGRIILWGRSMGAVTALLYASSVAGDSSKELAGLVLDSPFSSFRQLALDLTSKGMIRIPQFATATVLSLIRRSVRSRAGFDLYKLKPISRVHRCTCPALFLVAEGDELVPPWHGEGLQEKFGGPSVGLRFDGNHNSSRPGAIYSLALLFVTAAARRHRYNIQHALNLIEKTARITSQEEESAGVQQRHAFRYDGKEPRFIHVGSVIGNFAGVASTMMETLDNTLAVRSVEDFILDELVQSAVTVVHQQLVDAHCGTSTHKLEHARQEMANEALAPSARQATTWEKVVEAEGKTPHTAQDCQNVLQVLRQLQATDNAATDANQVSAPAPTRRRTVSLSKDGKQTSRRGKGRLHKGPSLSGGIRVGGGRPRVKVGGVRLCCFDPRDALLMELPTKREHLAEVADKFFDAFGKEGSKEEEERKAPATISTEGGVPPTGNGAIEMTPALEKKLSRSHIMLNVTNPSTQQSV